MCSTHFDLLSSVSYLSLPVRFPRLSPDFNTRIVTFLCFRIQTLIRNDEICVFKLLLITYIIKCEIHRIFVGPLGNDFPSIYLVGLSFRSLYFFEFVVNTFHYLIWSIFVLYGFVTCMLSLNFLPLPFMTWERIFHFLVCILQTRGMNFGCSPCNVLQPYHPAVG